ncbi:DNA polymerase III subunit delta [Ensifer soli]|uniref:DNA polymerase III subunit delta n=1 Tax=Ciceribacter sp. sgz301302 TaxID=3342379 RepID=UPI0035B73CA6
MVEIKSHDVDGYLRKGEAPKRLNLVYGPDRGLVAERAADIARRTGVALDDPFCVVKLDAADLQASPGRLIDEARAIGLFGGSKLVWIRNAMNEKVLVDGLQQLAAKPPEDSFLLIEAGDLKKGSSLRKLAEQATSAASIPCYADDRRALNALIDGELGEAGLSITPEARARLMELIGGDRMASRNEVRKLALYCDGLQQVSEEDVLAIVGDAGSTSADDAIDAVLTGNPDALHQAVARITRSKTPLFLVLNGCLRQFQLLQQMRVEMDAQQQSSATVLSTIGRHIHFRRKPLIETALRRWTAEALQREISRLNSTLLQSRLRPALEESIVMQTLLSLTLQSARR